MTDDAPILSTTDDVTDDILDLAIKTFDDWFDNDQPIDWEDFIDKMADPEGYNDKGIRFDFDEYDSPAVRKIQRTVRKHKNSGG